MCDAHKPPHSTSHRREIGSNDLPHARRRPDDDTQTHVCNGFDVTDAIYNLHSSIWRPYEHHMIHVPSNVCDAHEPPHSTSYGRDIDITTAGHTPNDAIVTVWTLRKRRTVSTRRYGCCMSTIWYHPRYVMVMSRPARRHTGEISI